MTGERAPTEGSVRILPTVVDGPDGNGPLNGAKIDKYFLFGTQRDTNPVKSRDGRDLVHVPFLLL